MIISVLGQTSFPAEASFEPPTPMCCDAPEHGSKFTGNTLGYFLISREILQWLTSVGHIIPNSRCFAVSTLDHCLLFDQIWAKLGLGQLAWSKSKNHLIITVGKDLRVAGSDLMPTFEKLSPTRTHVTLASNHFSKQNKRVFSRFLCIIFQTSTKLLGHKP